jgi:outer membrane protein OmpA-like peptidoglycan-associated protein
MTNLYSPAVKLVRTGALALVVAGCSSALTEQRQSVTEQRQSVVFFPTNSSELTPGALKVVQGVADRAVQAQPSAIYVEGHADGGSTRDATLAYERGRTVYRALQVAGVDANTIRLMQGTPRNEAKGVEAHKAVVRFER